MKKQSDIKEYTVSNFREAVNLLEKLGRIPAPSGHEDKRAEFCLDWFRKQGGKNAWIDERKNVFCSLDCDKYPDIAVFAAHTDVVFPDTEELPLKREGKRVYAPGIGDNTGNLINLMMAAKYILNKDIPMGRGIIIAANSCEEGLGNLEGCKEIFRRYGDRITSFFSFDGYMSQCISIPVGSHRYKITVKTQGGHSYKDFGRENAILTMAYIVQKLYDIKLPKEEKTTCNVGCAKGGTSVNSIPSEAYFNYEYRSSSGKCLEIMQERFEHVIGSFKRAGKDVSVENLGMRPGRPEGENRLLDEWTQKNIRIIRKYYDGPMDTAAFSTDSNIPLSLGILANTIGTVTGEGAHTRQEWIDTDSLIPGTGIILELMLGYAK